MDVLLVERDASLRDAVTLALRRAGFRVAGAPSGEDALAAALDQGRPKVLVTAIGLGPGMNGFALVGEMRRRWPSVLVVLMGEPGSLPQSRRLGAAERFLLKPVAPEAIAAEVRALVRGVAA